MNFKKIKKVVTALALTVMLGATSSTVVEALPKPGANKELKIAKVLTVAEGVKTPDTTFTFEFEKYSYNGKKDGVEKLPAIPNGTVQYSSTDDLITQDDDKTAPGRQLKKLSEDVLQKVRFNENGQYTYVVREVKGQDKGVTYSDQAYIISIFVEPDKKGGNPVATSFQIATFAMGEAEDEIGTKQDYTPDVNSDFKFENTYDKVVETTEGTKTEGFVLKKEVVGSSQTDTNRYSFSMTVTKPEGTKNTDAGYTYYLSSKPTEVLTGTYGTENNFALKHGEEIVFKKVLLGSKVKVEETDSLGFDGSVKAGSTLNGVEITSPEKLKEGNIIGDNGDNSVTYVNTQQTPTGILLNNLPFIVLAILAGTGIFFFVKNRNNEEEMEA